MRQPALAGPPRRRRTQVNPTPARAVAREPDSRFPTDEAVVYDGAYGPWTVTPTDVAEVVAYRAGLAAAAAAGAAAVASATLPALQPWVAAHPAALNAACAAGTAGMGLSLALLHLYIAPLKRVLLGLWAAGAVGAGVLAASHPGTALPSIVAGTPSSMWAVGPALAAVTGLAIKEGLCYGKAECAALAALLPVAALAHLSGLAPPAVTAGAADAAAAAALLWIGRKLATQPLVEDIGDKSVFEFRALSLAEQAAVLARLKAAAAGVVEAGEVDAL
jgi:uncharacterized integral membrane protein